MKDELDHLVGITGMPLAGKTTVAEIISDQGYDIVDMGDVVREETASRDIPTSKIGDWVTEIRRQKGRGAIADFTVEKIRDLEKTSQNVVVTGMRNWEEKTKFEEYFNKNMSVVAVWASTDTRKARRNSRQREEDQKGDGFVEREKREIRNGVGELLARSDYMIKNENTDLSKTKERTLNVLEEIEND